MSKLSNWTNKDDAPDYGELLFLQKETQRKEETIIKLMFQMQDEELKNATLQARVDELSAKLAEMERVFAF
jgi:hypothetical protein